jgi:hypothetical protein
VLAPKPVDIDPPTTTITSGPAEGSTTTSTSASFGFGSDEDGSTFECRLDGGSWSSCTSPQGFTGLSVAKHVVEVRATDAAGNVEPDPASRSWAVVAPPAVQPGSTNTGVPVGTKLSVYDGDLTITTAGTVIDGLDIHGFVWVKAANVTIRNSIVRGGQAGTTQRSLISSTQPGVLIEDTELAPAYPSVNIDGLKGYGFTARRLNIHDAVDTAVIYGDNTTIEQSWLHDNRHYDSDPRQGGGPSHDDGIQVQGGSNIRLHANTITGGVNAAIMVTQDYSATTDLTITDSWLGRGACTVNIAQKARGPLQGLQVTGNQFTRDSTYKCPMIIDSTTRTTTTASNNTYTDTQPITISWR